MWCLGGCSAGATQIFQYCTVYRIPWAVYRILYLSVVCSSVDSHMMLDPISYLLSKNLKRHRSLSYNILRKTSNFWRQSSKASHPKENWFFFQTENFIRKVGHFYSTDEWILSEPSTSSLYSLCSLVNRFIMVKASKRGVPKVAKASLSSTTLSIFGEHRMLPSFEKEKSRGNKQTYSELLRTAWFSLNIADFRANHTVGCHIIRVPLGGRIIWHPTVHSFFLRAIRDQSDQSDYVEWWSSSSSSTGGTLYTEHAV